jgi:gluconate 2-dehydrogenase
LKPNVYITVPVPREVEDYIATHCTYRKWEGDSPITRDRLLEEMRDVEGLFTTGGRIDSEFLSHAPNLKIVSNSSVGYNNFDIEAMRSRNVIGTHTPYVLDDTVADLVFGLILSAARRIPELDQYVKNGNWKSGEKDDIFGIDVHHSTLGIIGMGRIGEAISKRAKFGFDMNVLYYNRTRKPDVESKLGVTYTDFNNLLQASDFIVLMTPLTSETEHMIGKREFEIMKNSAIFVNASRGRTVDEQAMILALQQGQIRGAGLDVFDIEPVNPDNPLLQMPQVVTLPHIGSATSQTRFDMAMLAAKNLVSALKNEEPPYIVPELKK